MAIEEDMDYTNQMNADLKASKLKLWRIQIESNFSFKDNLFARTTNKKRQQFLRLWL